MTKEFKYLKEGITSDIIGFLMGDYGLDMAAAMTTFYGSDTFSKLSEPSTGLYYQSSRYVYTYLQHEIKYGVIC